MKKTKKNKINLLDVIIIIILFSLIVAAYLKTNHRELSMMNIKETTASIVFRVEGEYATEKLNKIIGTELYLFENNQKIGVVDHIEFTKMNEAGNDSKVINEAGFDYNENEAIITLNNVIVKKSAERGCYLNGSYFIANGKTVEIKTQDGEIFTAKVDLIHTND